MSFNQSLIKVMGRDGSERPWRDNAGIPPALIRSRFKMLWREPA